ncbi:hypothetical protein D3C78_1027160 [compost metagenome]
MHTDATRTDVIAAPAADAAIAAEGLAKALAELVLPETLHALPRQGAGVVAAGFLLEALVQARIPYPLLLDAAVRQLALQRREAGAGRAYRGAAGTDQAAQAKTLPGRRADLGGIDRGDTVLQPLPVALLAGHLLTMGHPLCRPVPAGGRQGKVGDRRGAGHRGNQQQPAGLAGQQDQVGSTGAYLRAAIHQRAETLAAAVSAVEPDQQRRRTASLIVRIRGEELVLIGDGRQVAGMQTEQHLRRRRRLDGDEALAVEAEHRLALGEEERLGGKRRRLGLRHERGGIVGRQRLPVTPALAVLAHFVQRAAAGEVGAQTLDAVQLATGQVEVARLRRNHCQPPCSVHPVSAAPRPAAAARWPRRRPSAPASCSAGPGRCWSGCCRAPRGSGKAWTGCRGARRR